MATFVEIKPNNFINVDRIRSIEVDDHEKRMKMLKEDYQEKKRLEKELIKKLTALPQNERDPFLPNLNEVSNEARRLKGMLKHQKNIWFIRLDYDGSGYITYHFDSEQERKDIMFKLTGLSI